MAEEQVVIEVEAEPKKKGGKVKKFFLFAILAAIVAGAVKFFRGRSSEFEEDEWQELPPPAGA
jgi:hypothetical protein